MKVGWLVFNVNYLALMVLFPGFEVLSSKLRKLDLSGNRFNDKSILSCLTGLSTLESLDLSANGLTAGSGSFYGNLLIIFLWNILLVWFFSMRLFPSNMLLRNIMQVSRSCHQGWKSWRTISNWIFISQVFGSIR